jgi:hypothetical protein
MELRAESGLQVPNCEKFHSEKRMVPNSSIRNAGGRGRQARQADGRRSSPAASDCDGYRHARNQLERPGLSRSKTAVVKAFRTEECPIQLETVLEDARP